MIFPALERMRLRPPVQFLRPLSHLLSAHFTRMAKLAVRMGDSQWGQQVASQVHEPPRRIPVIRLKGVASQLAGSALQRGGTYHATRCGCGFNTIWTNLDARGSQEPQLRGVVSRERFLDAEDGKACRILAAGSVGSKQPSSAAPSTSPTLHAVPPRFSFCLLPILCAWVSARDLSPLPIALSARG